MDLDSQTLATIAAKTALRELSTRYAIACDEHDIDGLMALFSDDAKLHSPSSNMVAQGHADIRQMFIDTFKQRGPSFHWTHDALFELSQENPNTASGLVLGHAETTPNGVASIAALRYYDQYRCEDDGQWRIISREIRFFYYLPVEGYRHQLATTQRVQLGEAQHPADFPEALTTWQQFNQRYRNESD